ncbi:SO_0444 family Cu/Zn efflux transporter [Geopsychrobacter electrodiphilus]|uniref:SO_0444 family Cu/Zn efflux transporter n=1 Tax=Geopsychrobacter electrodiphilus TaxID=225196 RepID=UPI003CCC1B3B
MQFLTAIGLECWRILLEAAPYVLFGFFAAGLLKALVPEDVVVRHLGKSSSGSVFKAALFGVPLPLCSCGVIPAAIGLRKQGASKGAAASFLVSVPETGVDSIAITWALLGPLMAVVRPIAAFLTATITGLLINLLPEEPLDKALAASCECSVPGCADAGHQHVEASLWSRVRAGQAYAFGDLLGDIGKWLLLGVLLAAVISHLVPEVLIARYLGSEFVSLLIMLLVGIPLYICASASTPIAAALILKGLSPGAALVFLLAGPATNAATLTLVLRYFGRAATVIYLASLALCSLLFGFLLNWGIGITGLDLMPWVAQAGTTASSPVEVISAILLLLLIVRNLLPGIKGSSDCGCGDSCSS